MFTANFTLSAFGDEIADDLEEQLRLLRELHIKHLDLRRAWGKTILQLDVDEIANVRKLCIKHGVAVSCIASPVGKSAITDPIEQVLSNLGQAFQVAEAVGTHLVRIFSFYPPDTTSNAQYDDYIESAISRLDQLTGLAQRCGFTLLLENERKIVGDTPERCHAMLRAIDSPNLRFLWDPANFVVVGMSQPTERAWASLGDYVAYVHVKDALVADGHIKVAGEGDGQVGELLTKLQEAGYRGFLSLEPHLSIAGHSSGFSGADGMAYAVDALRNLMSKVL
jgi:sugar phosphate isomerase/epimerase